MMGFKQRVRDWLLKCALSLNLAGSESSYLCLWKDQTTTWQVQVLSLLIPEFSFLVIYSYLSRYVFARREHSFIPPQVAQSKGVDLTTSIRTFVHLLKMSAPSFNTGLWNQNLGQGHFLMLVGWELIFFSSKINFIEP